MCLGEVYLCGRNIGKPKFYSMFFYDHVEAQKKAQIVIDAIISGSTEILKSKESCRQYLASIGFIEEKKKAARSHTKK